jgi:hypothetical protein
MDSKILDVLRDRVLELGPKPAADGPYKNFKLTRDEDGIAWLLFDRAGASANTLSADLLEELDAIVAFYASPAGTKLIGAQPQIMREMLPSLTQKLQASLPVAMQKVIDDARAQGLDVGN